MGGSERKSAVWNGYHLGCGYSNLDSHPAYRSPGSWNGNESYAQVFPVRPVESGSSWDERTGLSRSALSANAPCWHACPNQHTSYWKEKDRSLPLAGRLE